MPDLSVFPVQQEKDYNPHVAICMPACKGHIQPAVVLAIRLVQLGISVTVICPDQPTYSSLASNSSVSLSIRLEVLDPNDYGDHKNPTPRSVMKGVRISRTNPEDLSFINYDPGRSQRHLEELLNKKLKDVACVVVDMLETWTQPVLSKLNIPKYILFTAATTHMAITRHGEALFNEKILPLEPHTTVSEIIIPGLPPMKPYDIPDELADPHHPLHSLNWDTHFFDARGILLNTAWAIEGKVIDAIRSCIIPGARFLPTKTLLPVGPLIPACFFGESQDIVLSSPRPQETKCKAFLDSQLPKSVIYVSFGSMAVLEEHHIEELAYGLEMSGYPFVWVMPILNKSGNYLERVLPVGFQFRTQSRGIILEDWAPQHLVLSHPALAGFITHCGWNSVLECLTAAGAPMVAWPFTHDQPVTCRWLVDELKIAVEVAEGIGMVHRKQVVSALKKIMEGPDAPEMRKRAEKLKSALRESVLSENGSSKTSLKMFVENVKSSVKQRMV